MSNAIGRLVVVTATIAASFVPFTARAESEPVKKPPVPSTEKAPASESSKAVALLTEATRLVQYARENKSAVAMVAAVQMLRQVSVESDKSRFGDKTADGPQAGQADKKTAAAPVLDEGALLQEAQKWAANDPTVLALVKEEASRKASKARGKSGGPACLDARVLAGNLDIWQINYRAQELAAVLVRGDGDTDLDCFVFDQADNLLKGDDSYSPGCYLEWFTRYGGKFKVVVDNRRGGVSNVYRLCTN